MQATILPRKNNKLNAYILTNESRYKPNKDKKTIDLEVVKALCMVGATMEEIAAVLGVSSQWIVNEREANPAMALAMEQGYSEMKVSLRRTQIELASSGNATMLIWLGKQYLGQSDKQVVDNNTTINITVQRAMDELRNIPKEQLLSSRNMLRHIKNEAQDAEFTEESGGKADPPPPVAV